MEEWKEEVRKLKNGRKEERMGRRRRTCERKRASAWKDV